MDFYSDTVQNKEFHLLDFWPNVGDYTFGLNALGKIYGQKDFSLV